MKKTKLSFKFIASVIVLFVITTLFVVSVLGENNSAKGIIDRYIAALSTNDIDEISTVSSKGFSDKFTSAAEARAFHNALGIAIFDHFDIQNGKDYLLDIDRKNTWFPYIGSDDLQFDFQMKRQKNGSILSPGAGTEEIESIMNLFVLTREDGGWKIGKIDINNQAIAKKLQYIAEQNIILSEITIDPDGNVSGRYKDSSPELTSIQKRIVINKMQSAIQRLQGGDKIN